MFLTLGFTVQGRKWPTEQMREFQRENVPETGGWQEPAADSSQPSVGHCDETRLASDAGGQGDLPPCSGCCLDFSQQLSIHAGLNSGAKELTTGPLPRNSVCYSNLCLFHTISPEQSSLLVNAFHLVQALPCDRGRAPHHSHPPLSFLSLFLLYLLIWLRGCTPEPRARLASSHCQAVSLAIRFH